MGVRGTSSMARALLLSLLLSYFTLLSKAQEKEFLLQVEDSCLVINRFLDSLFENNLLNNPDLRERALRFESFAATHNCTSYPNILNLRGFAFYTQNDMLASRKLLLKADSLFTIYPQRGDLNHARNQIFLGLTYNFQLDFKRAIHYFKVASEMSGSPENTAVRAEALSNLGWALFQQGELEEAQAYLIQAKDLSILSNNLQNLGYIYQNLAQISLKLGPLSDATQYIREAEEIWKKIKDTTGLYYITQVKARKLFQEQNWEGNLKALHQAIEYGEISQTNHLNGLIFSCMGEAYSLLGNSASAISSYEKALQNGENLPFEVLNSSSQQLAELYLEKGEVHKLEKLFSNLAILNQRKRELDELENKKWVANKVALEKEQLKTEMLLHTHRLEQENLRLKNTYILLLLVVTALFGCLGILSYFQYRQKRALYLQLNQQKGQLEKINTQLKASAQTVAHQNELLTSQNEELENFAHSVAHDLKAPLLNMVTLSSILNKKWSPSSNKEVREILAFIEGGSKDMYNLVVDLLEFAQLETKKLPISTIPTHELLEEVLQHLNKVLDEKKAEVVIEAMPTTFRADPIKVKLVFQNLIQNAVKFVPEGVRPQVKIGGKEDQHAYSFFVQDNGIGIDQADQEQIFTMLSKLHSKSEFEGSGIGLATCKKIVHLHGGTMHVESELGKGSTFHFNFPKNLTEGK